MAVITAATLFEITPIVCARCHPDIARFPGRAATASEYTARLYPWPPGRGTLWCPVHSPTWLQAFLEAMTAKLQSGWRPPRARRHKTRR